MTSTRTPQTRRGLRAAALAFALLAASCSGDDTDGDTGGDDTTSTEPATVDPNDDSVVELTDEQEAVSDDLARFVAAAESAIEGSDAEGDVVDAPDLYIAIAESACARFTDGESFDDVAADLLTGDDAIDGDDSELLVGAVLGAAIETICPEHSDKL